MSAPAGVHQEARRRAVLIIEREYVPDPARCVKAIIALLTYRSPVASDTAAPSRPLGAGARPAMQHDDRTTRPRNLGAVAMEDTNRDPLTSDAE
jgi:hypothetical protein